MTSKPTLSLVLVWILLVTPLPSTAARPSLKQDNESTDEQGLQFRLSEVAGPAETPAASNPTVAAENLSDAETRKLLARIPALKADASDTLNFQLPGVLAPGPDCHGASVA